MLRKGSLGSVKIVGGRCATYSENVKYTKPKRTERVCWTMWKTRHQVWTNVENYSKTNKNGGKPITCILHKSDV